MNTHDTLITETTLNVLFDDLEKPTQLELPPFDPWLVRDLLPTFRTRIGPVPHVPNFAFILWTWPSMLEVGFVHVPTQSEFLLVALLQPSIRSSAYWRRVCSQMRQGKDASYGPAPMSTSWAAAGFPQKSLDCCDDDASELFFFLPAFTAALFHCAANQN